MACLGLFMVKQGCAGINGGIDSEQGVLTGVDGVVDDLAGV